MFDAIIVGGGVIGLSVAWDLQRKGLQTLVLERGAAGREASWMAAGMLCPVAEAHFTERELLELSLKSMALYPDYVREIEEASGSSVAYNTTGTLVAAMDSDEVRVLRRLLEFQQELELPAYWLNGDECRTREPNLSPRVLGGISAPQDHQIDNRRLVEALALGLKSIGGRVRERTPVVELLIEGGRVAGVRTPAARLPTKHVIIAAGAWSRQLEGLPDGFVPPVRPVKGQLLCLDMDPSEPVIAHTIRGRRAYVVPRRDGQLLVGATSEEKGFDRDPTAGGIYELLRGVCELIPTVADIPVREFRVGLRPGSHDNLPILGPCDIEGLLFATGHHRGGVLLAPVTAWAIRRTILDGGEPAAISPFRISRLRAEWLSRESE